MNDNPVNTFQYIVLALLSLLFGLYLRRRLDGYKTNKFIRELEEYFGQELPSFKKDREKVHWQRVLKMLKEEPTTDKTAAWKTKVKKLIDAEKKR